jgi:Tfp pilus assembly protein PilX
MPNPEDFASPAVRARHAAHAQAGAITIMVALMLLVLLTISAVGMSRNSFREVVNSGFSRQAAMAANVADSGLEWAVYWSQPLVNTSAAADAQNLVALKENMLVNNLSGVALNITDPTGGTAYSANPTTLGLSADMTSPAAASPTGVIQGYTIGLTYMGHADTFNNSNGSSFQPANTTVSSTGPNLWAIRSDAQVQQNNVVFTHAKEAWITTPLQ